MTVDQIIEGVIGREGAYSNNPNDTGGETMWGVTARVARAAGYNGSMRDMPRSVAKQIFLKKYVQAPGFYLVLNVNERIAEELVDTGINMGPDVAARFLQEALNGLNDQGRYYADILEDADVGPATVNALKAYLAKRGVEAEAVMLRALNCLQGARYIELARGRPKNEDFLYGWLRTRVS